MNYTGPYKIVSVKNGTYVLRDLKNNKVLEPCKVHLLKPFHYDATITNPVEIRLKDTDDMYIVEQILSHTGNFKFKKSLRFQVKDKFH